MEVKKLNQLKNFMQIEVDVKCMQTNFGRRDLSGFGDFVPFSVAFKIASFSSNHGIVHGAQKIELTQKNYASRG